MTQRNSITFESVTYLGAETTCGTHPGDGALTRIKIVKGGLLASGFMEAREENPDESQSRYDNPKRTKGLKKGSKWGPLKVQLKSIKTAARLGVAGSLSALSHRVMLKHTFGTEYAAVGCTIGVGSTRTSVVVDSTTGRRAGEIVLVELGSGATAVNKIAAVNDGTHLTMTYPLPSAPESGGEVRGFYTYAMAEARDKTLTIEQKHVSNAGEEARALGCFASPKLELPELGKVPTWTLEGTCVDWQDGATLADPAFGASTPADDDMGPPMVWQPRVFIGSSIDMQTASRWSLEKMTVDIMVNAEEIPDAAYDSMVGGYMDTGGRENGTAARLSMSVRYDPALESGFTGQTEVSLFLTNTDTNGNVFVLDVGRMYLVEHTKPVTLGKNRRGMSLVYEVRRDTTTTLAGGASAADKDIAWTPVRVALGG